MSSILLDTSALIWWDQNNPRLGGKGRAAIQTADHVYVSAVSAVELCIKQVRGKLRMKRTAREVVGRNGFLMMPIGFEHAEAVATLPLHHRDPFDRLLIATATVEQLTILTSDRVFWRYDVPLLDALS